MVGGCFTSIVEFLSCFLSSFFSYFLSVHYSWPVSVRTSTRDLICFVYDGGMLNSPNVNISNIRVITDIVYIFSRQL